MKKLIFFIYFLNSHALFSANTLPFKEEVSFNPYWWQTCVILLILLIILLLLPKKNPLKVAPASQLTLLEKKTLSHKTCVYVLQYQGVQFLLADNHTQVTLHPLEPRVSYEKK